MLTEQELNQINTGYKREEDNVSTRNKKRMAEWSQIAKQAQDVKDYKQTEDGQSFLQKTGGEILRPFLRLAAGGFALKEGISAIRKGKGADIGRSFDVDVPFIGKVEGIRPFGFDEEGKNLEIDQWAKDIIGGGLEIGATFVPTARVSKFGGQLAKGAFGQALKTGAKTGAVAGGLGMGGVGLQEQKSIGGALLDATIGATAGAALGAALPVLGATTKGLVKAVGGTVKLISKIPRYTISRFPKLLQIATGESSEVIEKALANPRIADKALQEGTDVALRKAAQEGSDNSIRLRESFIKGHSEGFAEFVRRMELQGVKTPAIKKGWIIKSFTDLLESRGVKVLEDGSLDFSISKIATNPGEVGKIMNFYNALNSWDDFSLVGLNKLKQLNGLFTRFADEAGIPSKSPTLGSFYHTLNETIKRNLPDNFRKDYIGMNQKFVDNIDIYDDMVDAFNKGDTFTKLANALGKNKDSLRQILEFYEKKTGESPLTVVAARELAAEKKAAFGFLNPRSWIDFFWSPEQQAKAVITSGKVMEKLKIKPKPPVR